MLQKRRRMHKKQKENEMKKNKEPGKLTISFPELRWLKSNQYIPNVHKCFQVRGFWYSTAQVVN